MILVDTSIWINYLKGDPLEHLDCLLEGESVVMHDFVIGEMAMGSLKNRPARLDFFRDLHRIPAASEAEVGALVESAPLYSKGLSYIGAHLLAAARASGDTNPVRIWTGDHRLHEQALALGIAYVP